MAFGRRVVALGLIKGHVCGSHHVVSSPAPRKERSAPFAPVASLCQERLLRKRGASRTRRGARVQYSGHVAKRNGCYHLPPRPRSLTCSLPARFAQRAPPLCLASATRDTVSHLTVRNTDGKCSMFRWVCRGVDCIRRRRRSTSSFVAKLKAET